MALGASLDCCGGNPETLLVDFAFGFAPQAALSGLGLLRGGVGEVGVLQRLRGQGAPGEACATNGVPLSYELTPANVADASLTQELLAEAALGDGVARRLLGDLAYRSEGLKEALAEVDILLVTEPSASGGVGSGSEWRSPSPT